MAAISGIIMAGVAIISENNGINGISVYSNGVMAMAASI
jgi:hypothetical protein